MDLKNIWTLGVKELRELSRDPIMVLLILYSFSLSVWTSSHATPETLTNAAISIVDEDQSQLSKRIISAFYPPQFVTPQLITAAEMDARMDEGIDTFALVIPPEFERDVLAGKTPEIQLNIDATRMSQAFSGGGYIQQIVSGEVAAHAAGGRGPSALPVEIALRAKFNPALDPSWFSAISSVIQSITMLALVLTGAALIREKEHGTVEHLLVMPVTAAELMLSKIWSMGVVVLAGSVFSLTVMVQWLMGVPVAGSVPLFFAGAVLMLFAMTALGIFMATLAGSMPQFALLLIMVLLPLQVLSGGMTARESMPQLVQDIMLLAPNTHFIMLSQSILFRGAGFGVVWPQFLALFAIGCGLFWLALRRFKAFLK